MQLKNLNQFIIMLKMVVLLNIFVERAIYIFINKNKKQQNLVWIIIFYNILNVFTVTFNHIFASLPKKTVLSSLKKNISDLKRLNGSVWLFFFISVLC